MKKVKASSGLSESLQRIKGFSKLRDAIKAGENDTSVGAEAYLISRL